MLQAKYSNTPLITQTDAKQHLHNIRYQRQNQLATIINECHQLRISHKRIFDNQLNFSSNEKSLMLKPLNREAVFIFNSQTESNNSLSVIKEDSQYLSESSYTFLENQLPNNRLLSRHIKKNQQQHLSVSSIEKFPPISTNKIKSNKSTKFVDAIKQMKNRSSIQRHLINNKSNNNYLFNEKFIFNTSIKEIQPKLPSILCPSSFYYSKQIQTRQWLCFDDDEIFSYGHG
ncbi:unnamed protein product [Rotaria sp. Silwood1]|nr:unnamed protein product [Rotaria sp. Silwood1]CAF4876576.1 unnamed protein product [Rotaria sp. Silwood1]